MYKIGHFKEDSLTKIHQLIRDYSFATLITKYNGDLIINHFPLLLELQEGTQGKLLGHMARDNPQRKMMVEAEEVQVIFQGPHTYISPTWYETLQIVPTWNYAVVHVHGNVHLVENLDGILDIMNKFINVYEKGISSWSVRHLGERLSGVLEAIVGFEIEITEIESKFKLSQNRPKHDQEKVIKQLMQSTSSLDHQVAEQMKQNL